MRRIWGLMIVWLAAACLVGLILRVLGESSGLEIMVLARWESVYPWRWPLYNTAALAAGLALGQMIFRGRCNSLYTALWGFMLYRVLYSIILVILPVHTDVFYSLLPEGTALTLVLFLLTWLYRGEVQGRSKVLEVGCYLALLRTSLLLASVALGPGPLVSQALLAAVLAGLVLAVFEFYNLGLGKHPLLGSMVIIAITGVELLWRLSSDLPGQLAVTILLSRALIPLLVVWSMAWLLPDHHQPRLVVDNTRDV